MLDIHAWPPTHYLGGQAIFLPPSRGKSLLALQTGAERFTETRQCPPAGRGKGAKAAPDHLLRLLPGLL